MKTKHIILTVMAVFTLSTVVIINACKKDISSESIIQTESEYQNDDFTENILSFIDNCRYHIQNPGLKSTDSIPVDSAVKNLEAAMNLMYTFYVKTSDLYTATSEITITVEDNDKMTESNIAQALEDIEDAVRDDYGNAPYTNKKLITVMLDYSLVNNAHKISITAITGNTTVTLLQPPRDWLEGRYAGDCDNTIGGTDAAEEIQKAVTALYWEEPPANATYYWPNPEEFDHFVGPDKPNSYSDYENVPDPDPVNYKDYIIFYLADNLANYENPHCMLGNDEMPFYNGKYRGLVDEALASGTNYKFKECDFNGVKIDFPELNDLEILRHELKIIVGRRIQINITCNYPTNIE